MSAVGIVAEFNPLHNGHKYLIENAKREGTVVCVISGNFVQRGDTAIAEKRIRAKAALECGADLVLELPTLWSMSTAQNFALGSVSALKYALCDKIIFGSECGSIDDLKNASSIVSSPLFPEKLKSELNKGITFAKARENAAKTLGLDSDILSGANNNLAIEYINAAKTLVYEPEFKTVTRLGAMHDSLDEAEFVSASLLREKLYKGDYNFCKKYMPENIIDLFSPQNISNIANIENAILAVLRSKPKEEFALLPDLSEGVENKLFSSIRLTTNLEELYNMIKVKRYTLARIRRLVLSAFIGADNSFFMKPLPYIRVLGFNKSGEKHLKFMLTQSNAPIITKVSDIERLSTQAKKVFSTECRATDLFALSVEKPLECGLEYTSKIIKTES